MSKTFHVIPTLINKNHDLNPPSACLAQQIYDRTDATVPLSITNMQD